jgi:hypothetical protein
MIFALNRCLFIGVVASNGRIRPRSSRALKGRAVKLHLLDLGGDVAGNGMSKLFLTIAAAFADAMPRGDALTLFRRPCSDAGDLPRAMRAPRAIRHLQGSSKQHGDAELTVPLQTLADCPKARSASIYDHCQARLMDAPASTPRCIELIFVSREGIKARVAELTRSAPQQRAQPEEGTTRWYGRPPKFVRSAWAWK